MPSIRTISVSGSIPSITQLALGDLAVNTFDGKAYLKKQQGTTQTVIEIGSGGAASGVTQIIAGTNITISPVGGTGIVTINAGTPISASYALSSSYAVSSSYAANGGVTQLLAGPNITLSPTNGVGQVTISSTGGSGGSGNTATGSYGSFYDTTTQTNPTANIPRSMSFNTTDITNGVSISGSTSPYNTYIKTENAGVYDIQFSAQIDKTDSGTDEIIIWLRKNGIDLTDTATTITTVGNSAKYVAAWNWFVNSAANDYYQIIWISADTSMRLLAESISGTHPGIPSVIVTANRVDQFLSNTGSFSGSFIGSHTGSFTGSFTGSLLGTATAALTASYVNPLRQDVIITGSLIIQPTSSATQAVAIIQAGSGSLALVPSGSGAIIASVPDGTATGGNARGSYSVDLQMSRNTAAKISSGNNSGILSGYSNTASGFNSAVFGGNNNNASGAGAMTAGQDNNASAELVTVFGRGNTASSNYSTISGGQSNTASTGTHATVVGGSSNTSSGQYSVAGGFSAVASGQLSCAIGRVVTASGQYSTAFGNQSLAYQIGFLSHSSGPFAASGDSQYTTTTARRESSLTTAATAILSIDGSGTTAFFIPNGNNRMWNVTVKTIATVTTITGTATGVSVGNTYQETTTLCFKRVGGTSSIVSMGSTQQVYDASMNTAQMNYTAGASQELKLEFQAPVFAGGGSITCRVVSKVELTEVAY